jgi:proteasome lid subunit RPN8/RPN11
MKETTVKQLHVPRRYLEKLRTASKEAQSEETCGLLFGHKDEDSFVVMEFKILQNIDRSIVRFTIDPMTLYETLIDAEKRGLSLVAIFHSHPMGAVPSGTDKKYMRFWPVPWLILSKTNNKFGVFISDEDTYQRIKMKIT